MKLVTIDPVAFEMSFEIVDGRAAYDEACLYYNLPRSLRLRFAKKVAVNCQ